MHESRRCLAIAAPTAVQSLGRPETDLSRGSELQHEADRHPDRRRRHAGPQRDDPRRRRARQPAARRGLRLHQGLLGPAQPARAPRPPEPALHRDPRARPHPRRHGHRRLARLRRPGRPRDDRPDRRPAEAAQDRRPHLRRRRRHAERPAALRRALPRRARPEDDRQRPRPQPPERARRVGARARAPDAARLPLPARPLAHPLRARRDGQLRDARLRHRRLRLRRRACSACARRPRATAASRSSR